MREIRVPPAPAVFQCLQLKVISVPKQHMLGWCVLKSFSRILGQHIQLPFTMRGNSGKFKMVEIVNGSGAWEEGKMNKWSTGEF